MEATSLMQHRIVRRPEVEAVTGLSRATIYRLLHQGLFPQPVKLGPNSVGWRESSVREWLESREPAVEVPERDTSHENEDRCRVAPQPPGRGEPSDGSG